MKKLKVTLKGGITNCQERARLVVKALGLGKADSSKVHPDNPAIRGMIFKVNHLLRVEEVEV